MATAISNSHEISKKEMSASQSFVTMASLKNYATATGSLTLVINVILYCYSAINNGAVLPLAILIPVALSLSVFYILSFFQREEGITLSQHIWLTALNSLMLFTSISGVNAMLDKARTDFYHHQQSRTTRLPGNTTPGTKQASVGSFFEHLIFPTHGWFSSEIIEVSATKQEVNNVISSLDTTQKLMDTLLIQRKTDVQAITVLNKRIDSLQTQYLQTLQSFTQAQHTIQNMTTLLEQHNVAYQVPAEVMQFRPKIEADKQTLIQQQLLRQEQLPEQRQQQQQQIQQIQKQKRQLQQQQQVLQQIQQQQQMQQ